MPEFLNGEFFVGLFFVLVTNLILSGDNAVVIAMAARRLDGAQRRQAIIGGAAGAVVLRLIFAAVIAYLIHIPFLQVVGGLLLVWIAWKLVHEEEGDEEDKVQAGESMWEAIRIIIVADAVMSLDNVIALVQAAKIEGETSFLLLTIGLATTIPLVVFGAALLTSLMDRFPALIYAGAGLLVYLSVEMFFGDTFLAEYIEPYADMEWLVEVVAVAAFVAIAWVWSKRKERAKRGERDIEKPPEKLDK
ncbi:MAG: TerC family protein [Actinomycetota bacterium]|nr:TerC family protein [Actinomycetota bacterium]